MKNFNIDIWKGKIAEKISDLPMQVTSIEAIHKKTDDGQIDVCTRVNVITLGRGKFAHIPFSVKIPDTVDVKVTEETLEEADFEVFLKILKSRSLTLAALCISAQNRIPSSKWRCKNEYDDTI